MRHDRTSRLLCQIHPQGGPALDHPRLFRRVCRRFRLRAHSIQTQNGDGPRPPVHGAAGGQSRLDRLSASRALRRHGRPHGGQAAGPHPAGAGRHGRCRHHPAVPDVTDAPGIPVSPLHAGRHALRLRDRRFLGRYSHGFLLVSAANPGNGPCRLRRAGKSGPRVVRAPVALSGDGPGVHRQLRAVVFRAARLNGTADRVHEGRTVFPVQGNGYRDRPRSPAERLRRGTGPLRGRPCDPSVWPAPTGAPGY